MKPSDMNDLINDLNKCLVLKNTGVFGLDYYISLDSYKATKVIEHWFNFYRKYRLKTSNYKLQTITEEK